MSISTRSPRGRASKRTPISCQQIVLQFFRAKEALAGDLVVQFDWDDAALRDLCENGGHDAYEICARIDRAFEDEALLAAGITLRSLSNAWAYLAPKGS